MKPNLIFISHVIPLERSSGQKQRVFHMIKEARKNFRVVFLTVSEREKVKTVRFEMEKIVDKCIAFAN